MLNLFFYCVLDIGASLDTAIDSNFLSLKEMLHRKCVTESGDEAGAVKDIVIDIEQKKIKAIKLSEGFWERLTGRGIRYLPAAAVIKWSPDPIVIKEEANDQWVDNLQQLK